MFSACKLWLQRVTPVRIAMCAEHLVATSFPTCIMPDYIIVKEYEYRCNDKFSGTLYLKEPVRQCSWLSGTSGLRTQWHGEWVPFNGTGFVAQFDCRGQPNVHKHAVLYGDLRGHDYAGRRVEVILTGRWRFENEQAEYVLL